MRDQRQPLRPSGVELNIGELVLDGFPAMDRAQLGSVVQEELSRLFAERGAPAALVSTREMANLDAGTFQVPPDASAQAIGAQIAQAVYGGLCQ